MPLSAGIVQFCSNCLPSCCPLKPDWRCTSAATPCKGKHAIVIDKIPANTRVKNVGFIVNLPSYSSLASATKCRAHLHRHRGSFATLPISWCFHR
ncbi:Uncharacterised protein [Vibrio cholerae]|nr:Uncharacterised protein [Vibrio cholerae]